MGENYKVSILAGFINIQFFPIPTKIHNFIRREKNHRPQMIFLTPTGKELIDKILDELL